MKITNADLIELMEIKQYFLEPPLTFKLPVYVNERTSKALDILKKYPFVKPADIEMLENLQKGIEEKTMGSVTLKTKMTNAGIMIANLANR